MITHLQRCSKPIRQYLLEYHKTLEKRGLCNRKDAAYAQHTEKTPEDVLPLLQPIAPQLMEDYLLKVAEDPEINAASLKKPYAVLEALKNNGKLEVHTLLGMAHSGTTAFTRTALEAAGECGLHEPIYGTFADEEYGKNPKIKQDPWVFILFAYVKARAAHETPPDKPVQVVVKDMVTMDDPLPKDEMDQAAEKQYLKKMKAFHKTIEKLNGLSTSKALLYRPVEDVIASGLKTTFDRPMSALSSRGKANAHFEIISQVHQEMHTASILLQKHDMPVLDMEQFLKGSPQEALSVVEQATQPLTNQTPDPSCMTFTKPYVLTYQDMHSLDRINDTTFHTHQNRPAAPTADYARYYKGWTELKELEALFKQHIQAKKKTQAA